jgi:hypothetical protein
MSATLIEIIMNATIAFDINTSDESSRSSRNKEVRLSEDSSTQQRRGASVSVCKLFKQIWRSYTPGSIQTEGQSWKRSIIT